MSTIIYPTRFAVYRASEGVVLEFKLSEESDDVSRFLLGHDSAQSLVKTLIKIYGDGDKEDDGRFKQRN